MLIEIDTEEWKEYKVFCTNHEVKPDLVYDGEYSLMVRIPIELVFTWVMFITIGEDFDMDRDVVREEYSIRYRGGDLC